MKRFEAIAATIFGLAFVLLAFAVATETIVRKVLNVSLQGVDELGGYMLAIGGAMAFAVALATRAHIRIDIVHDRFPRFVRVTLNMLSVLVLVVCALALLRMAYIAFSDSILFNATAQTPWATPLRYPQGLWVAALGLFLLIAVAQLVRVGVLLVRRDTDRLDREFSPRGSKEELEEELQDIKARGADQLALPTREAGR